MSFADHSASFRARSRGTPLAMDADVIVVGAGNAGLCAAHAARERGARVLVLEKAPRAWTGGNSAFTAGALRVAHGGLEDLRDLVEDDERLAVTDLEPYDADAFAADLARVTLGRGDAAMARTLADDSAGTLRWLRARGLRFRLMYERQAYEAGGRFRFWGGLAVGTVDGGRGLIEQHGAAAERTGVELRHDAAVVELETGGVVVRRPDGTREALRARTVVLAAGGFESNPALRAAYLGPNWDVAKVRGTPYNTGEVLGAALALGAQPYGHWSGCHAIQWDRDAPPTGDLELTNRFSRQSYPVGIVVNADGERFIDEGADFRNYTYAKYGAAVLRQPLGVAHQVFDAKSVPLLRTIDYEAPAATRVDADTLEELADGLGSTRRASPAPSPSTTPRSGRGPSTRRSRTGCARTGSRWTRRTGRWRSTRRRTPASRSRAGSRSRSGACASTRTRASSTSRAARWTACSRPASWSAASSSGTTPAAAG